MSIAKNLMFFVAMLSAGAIHGQEKPKIIIRTIEPGMLIATQKIGVANGLSLSVSFVLMDPSRQESRRVNGMIALLFLENLPTIKDYRFSGETQAKLIRGKTEFALIQPNVKNINEQLRAVEYSLFTATELLRFLERDGKLMVVVDGKKHQLSTVWNRHLFELVKEVQSQREKSSGAK